MDFEKDTLKACERAPFFSTARWRFRKENKRAEQKTMKNGSNFLTYQDWAILRLYLKSWWSKYKVKPEKYGENDALVACFTILTQARAA